MLKKTMLFASAIAMLAALVPAVASAENKAWTHGESPLGTNATVAFDGHVRFLSENGGVTCPTTGEATLEGPGSTGKVTSFAPTTTAGCSYLPGKLDDLCGSVDTHHSTGPAGGALSSSNPWIAHGTKFSDGTYGIVITNVHVDVGGTGFFCPDVTLKGNVEAKGDPHKATRLTISGTMDSSLGGHAQAGGFVDIEDSNYGTYGVTT